jgi:isopentenyl diphosphate isomerase/L-lactate dehydrogenase-like FMN-dependent dehydrogenase
LFTIAAVLHQIRRFPDPLLHKLWSGTPQVAVRRFVTTYSRLSLTWDNWDNLAWLREQTRLPILLKGILHPDDARLATAHGMDGIVVSNHGGRQVDGALGVLEASPAWLRRWQGGCRCCSTVVYGLALAGQQGVQDVTRNVLAELDLTMGLSGYTDMDAIGPHALVRGNATITSYSNSDNS